MLSTFQFISLALTIGGAVLSAAMWLMYRLHSMDIEHDKRSDQYQDKNQEQHSQFKSRLSKVESEQGKYVLHTECSQHRQRLRDAIDKKD